MERVEGSDGLPQNHFTHFEFVRLASPSEGQVVDEHLTAPVALVATSAKQLKLGYPTLADAREGDMEMPVQKKTLMVVPSVPSPVRPLAEGLHTFVLLLIFLGVLTDMTRGSQPTGTMIGLVGSTMVCLIGFQGIRQSNVTLVGIYVVLTVALLTMAFCGLIQGVLAHGFLHVSGACLGAYNLQGMKPKRFFV